MRTAVGVAQPTPPLSSSACGWDLEQAGGSGLSPRPEPQLRERPHVHCAGCPESLCRSGPACGPPPRLFLPSPLGGFLPVSQRFAKFLSPFTVFVVCSLGLILPLICWASVFSSVKWGGLTMVDSKALAGFALPQLLTLAHAFYSPLSLCSLSYHILFLSVSDSLLGSLLPLSMTLFPFLNIYFLS